LNGYFLLSKGKLPNLGKATLSEIILTCCFFNRERLKIESGGWLWPQKY